ncbi:hypothetical protein OAF30_03330 [Flavobacteriales bacterium]|nr:hypothetical protein [Flavobacteriales bacterium]
MKHLMTLIALVVAVTAGAQGEWPWNPDSDNDNVITVEDLMSVLSVFGSEFYVEYDAPETSEYTLAMVLTEHIGTQITCAGHCASIGGHLPSFLDMALFGPLIPFDHYTITDSNSGEMQNYLYSDVVRYGNESAFSGWNQLAYFANGDSTYLATYGTTSGNGWYYDDVYSDGYWKGYNGSSNPDYLFRCYCVGQVVNSEYAE